MTPHRISIKMYFAPTPGSDDGQIHLDPDKIVPAFHRWIREKSIEGLLIDVADYRHVHHGPAAMLIAHEMDYFIDLSDGRPGFTYVRKRPAETDTLGDDVRDGLRKLLIAAKALAENPDPHGPVAFAADEFRVQVIDRLHYPHNPDTVNAVLAEVDAALTEPLGGASVAAVEGDRRAPITLNVKAEAHAGLDALLGKLQGAGAGA